MISYVLNLWVYWKGGFYIMNLGKRIKLYRIQNGYTQEVLGLKIGVKKAAINKYEKETVVNLKQDTIKKLADAFSISVPELMGWENAEQIAKESNLLDQVKIVFGSDAVNLLIHYLKMNDAERTDFIESLNL